MQQSLYLMYNKLVFDFKKFVFDVTTSWYLILNSWYFMYTHNSVKKYCLACRYCAEISIKNIDERVWLCVERHRRSTTLNSGLNALTKLVRYVLKKTVQPGIFCMFIKTYIEVTKYHIICKTRIIYLFLSRKKNKVS